MATIEIRRAGFPFQRTFEEFRDRYSMIAPPHLRSFQISDKEFADAICNGRLGIPEESKFGVYHMGKTRVFFKDEHDRELERIRAETLRNRVIIIQRIMRGSFARKDLQDRRSAMAVILPRLRSHVVRQDFVKRYPAYVRNRASSMESAVTPRSESFVVSGYTGPAPKQSPASQNKTTNNRNRERGQFLDDLSNVPSLRGEYNPATFDDVAVDFFSKQRRVQRLKGEIDEVMTALTIPPRLEAETVAMADYAKVHFVSGVSEGALWTVPSTPLLKRSATNNQLSTDALIARTILLLFTGDVGFSKGSLKSTKRSQGSTLSRRTLKRTKSRRPSTHQQRSASNKLVKELDSAGLLPVVLSESPGALVRCFFSIALKQPTLHEECMCQIAQQIWENPSQESAKRSWILLVLGARCLTLSEDLYDAILRLISGQRTAPMAELAESTLRENFGAAPRKVPPSWLEIQAAKLGMQTKLTIQLPSGVAHRHFTTTVPSRVRPDALTRAVCDELQLRDTSGWTVFIESHQRWTPLRHKFEFVFDALSDTEGEFESEQR